MNGKPWLAILDRRLRLPRRIQRGRAKPYVIPTNYGALLATRFTCTAARRAGMLRTFERRRADERGRLTHVDGLVLGAFGVSSFGELPLSGDSGNHAGW